MTPQEQVLALLNSPGWTQDRLAEELGVSQSTVNRWTSGSDPRGRHRDAIRALYDQVLAAESEGDTERKVRLKGYVGAAQTIYQFDEGDADFVDAPPGASGTTEAVEVRGESMLPLYEDGTILYYSKQLPPDHMIGRRCVVKLADERVLVKTLRRGTERGLWSLLSLNAPDIEDVSVLWAAPIDWIKPRQV